MRSVWNEKIAVKMVTCGHLAVVHMEGVIKGVSVAIITYGRRTRGARQSGRHVARRQGRVAGGGNEKGIIAPAVGINFAWNGSQLIWMGIREKRTGGERAVRRERMGIGWWGGRAKWNKFEFAKDLISEENFWKGNLNDVLSATEGNKVIRGSGVNCDWGVVETDL
jgi:hypothetical protein